jgi:LysM repeat protein
VIQSGDSLSVVAERFGIRTADLAEFNAIEDVNSIKIGQEIRIPPTAATSSVDPPTTSVAEPTSTSEG